MANIKQPILPPVPQALTAKMASLLTKEGCQRISEANGSADHFLAVICCRIEAAAARGLAFVENPLAGIVVGAVPEDGARQAIELLKERGVDVASHPFGGFAISWPAPGFDEDDDALPSGQYLEGRG